AIIRTVSPDLIAEKFRGYGGKIFCATLSARQGARVGRHIQDRGWSALGRRRMGVDLRRLGAAMVLVIGSVFVFVYAAFPIVAGLIAAPALAAVSRPIQRFFARRLGSSGSALLVVAGFWIVLVLPGAWLATVVIRQAPHALAEVHQRADALKSSPLR